MQILLKLTLMIGMLLLSWVASTSIEVRHAISMPCLQQEKRHTAASQSIVGQLTSGHYSQFKLDQNFSTKIFDRYLRLLDPQRNLLLASDIQQFADKRQQLGDELLSGRLETAYVLYNLVQQRRLERYQYALSLLKKTFSFDKKDEVFESDRSSSAWPTTVQQLDTIWESRVKFDTINLLMTKKNQAQISNILTKRYQSALKRLVQVDNEDVFYTFMNAFASEIDPHTCYYSLRQGTQYEMRNSILLEGIGAVIQEVGDYAVVISLVAGGPADKSKAIAINDRIIGVGQPGKKMTEVIGWRLDDVIELIRGPRGTKVCLKILPHGHSSKPQQLILTRERIRLEDLAVKASVQQVGNRKLGVLTIPGFYVGLAEDVGKLLTKFNQQGIAGIVIDLRNNGGGSLTEVVLLTGLFIPNSPVVQIRDRKGKVTTDLSTNPCRHYKSTVTVLVDRLSASASELFAAAMQDYGRALIVGEQTFGKGTVQVHQAINEKIVQHTQPLGYLHYTTQKFYRVSGGSTQLKGVVPDIVMLPGTKLVEAGESFFNNALPWDSIQSADYQPYGDLTPYLERLRKQHHRRLSDNSEFAFIRQRLAHYHAIKRQGGIVSLNLKQRQKELQHEEALLLSQVNYRRAKHGKPLLKLIEDIPKEFNMSELYLEEALAITNDLLTLHSHVD